MSDLEQLAELLDLGSLLEELRLRPGGYELVAHWTQGEFHHDVTLKLTGEARGSLPGAVLVVATNCNGGIKELLCFDQAPERWALWHHRCPNVDDFAGELPKVLERAITHHWFDPCELLRPDARSELKPEFRQRQRGGGWEPLEGGSTGCGGNRTT
jgi:hypothetical protein